LSLAFLLYCLKAHLKFLITCLTALEAIVQPRLLFPQPFEDQSGEVSLLLLAFLDQALNSQRLTLLLTSQWLQPATPMLQALTKPHQSLMPALQFFG